MSNIALEVRASVAGAHQTVRLEHTSQMVLRGRRLACSAGRVIAERTPDVWQSARGRHDRILIQGDVSLRFEAPAYQYDHSDLCDEVFIVGGTVWNQARQLLAYYDAANDRWRDADGQAWTAIHITSPRPSPPEPEYEDEPASQHSC